MAERHVVIVGGGFTGTALAIHLARLGKAGLSVTIVEPRPQLARGVAYATQDPAHRVNVPADRMQLSAAQRAISIAGIAPLPRFVMMRQHAGRMARFIRSASSSAAMSPNSFPGYSNILQ